MSFNITQQRASINASVFNFLFSELIRYHQQYCSSVDELEDRLNNTGYSIGTKISELYCLRDMYNASSSSSTQQHRHNRHIQALQYLHSNIFKYLFNKQSDGLEQSINDNSKDNNEYNNEFYIYDNNSICNTYISLPKNMIDFNSSAFIGGIIRGYLDSCNYKCISVTTHNTDMPTNLQTQLNNIRTVYVIKFHKSVIEREQLYR